MSVEESKEGVGIEGDRIIPSTAATQFADNALKPFWSFKEASASDDFFDCYVTFKEFNCHEYLWNWQDRKMDELLVKKLVRHYDDFFKDRPIGKDCFVTFKVNSNASLESLGRLYMSVISTNGFAAGQDIHTPPLFEVVHSSSSSAGLLRFADLYNESVSVASDKLKAECGPKVLNVIPTHQFDAKAKWYPTLHSYFNSFSSAFRCKLDYFRPFVPRAAEADKLGFVGAVLATKRALSNYSAFSRISGIEALPILDSGPLLFRGGLSPATIRNFISTYPGVRTVTLTSAFRYDNSIEEVKESVSMLNRFLPKNRKMELSRDELARMTAVGDIFTKNWTSTIKRLPSLADLPKSLESLKRNIPKQLNLSFSLYSLGVPPEIIGTGRAILDCIKEGRIADLERFYPNIKDDLKQAGALLNKENLSFLAKTGKVWKDIQNDVKLIEDYIDASLCPTGTDSFIHRNHTSNVFHLRSAKKDFARDLMAAARARRCLG